MASTSLFVLLLSIIMMVILLLPFWIAMLVHQRKAVTKIERFKFSVLSCLISYAAYTLITGLLAPLIIFSVKLFSQIGISSDGVSHLALAMLRASTGVNIVAAIIAVVIALAVALKLAKYFSDDAVN